MDDEESVFFKSHPAWLCNSPLCCHRGKVCYWVASPNKWLSKSNFIEAADVCVWLDSGDSPCHHSSCVCSSILTFPETKMLFFLHVTYLRIRLFFHDRKCLGCLDLLPQYHRVLLPHWNSKCFLNIFIYCVWFEQWHVLMIRVTNTIVRYVEKFL